MSLNIVSQSIYILEITLTGLSFQLLMDVRTKDNQKPTRRREIITLITFICGYCLFQGVLQKAVVYFFGEIESSGILNIVIGFFATYIFYSGKFRRRLLSYLTYLGAALLAEILNIPLITHLLRENSIYGMTSINDLYSNPTVRVMCIVIEAQVIVALWVTFVFAVKIFKDKVWPKIYLWFVVLPVYEVFIFVVFYQNANKLDDSIIIEGFIFFLLGFLLDCMLTGLIIKIAKDRETAIKLENIERERQSELVYRELVNQNLEQMRMIRHDFKNQLQVVYAGLKSDMTNEEAEQILDEMANKIEASSTKRYCENNLVNIILGLKEKEAREDGINYNVQCVIPNELGISSVDLCTLYNNAIDNAIEATRLISEGEKYINISSGIVNGYLTMKITNPCAKDVDVSGATIPSTKNDKKNHGMGIRRIRQVAEEHEGMVKFDCTDKVFELLVGLRVD